MPTNYPNGANGGRDNFNEPSAPEFTPLSSAGQYGTRNHVEHHRDLGDAIEAIQIFASRRGHDHSGDASNPDKGPKLSQANTHQNADTDSSPSALHHTLGSGPNQAAPGNHNHTYEALPDIPWLIRTSTSLPTDREQGTMAYEADTNRVRVYTSLRGEAPRWVLSTMASVPICRLRQNTAQTINGNGTLLQWGEVIEDSFGYFNPANPTNINITESGLYHIDASVQWDPSWVPEVAVGTFTINGQETTIREQRFIKNGIFVIPGFSQTLSVSGKIRINAGSTLAFKASHQSTTNNPINFILSFFDPASKVTSRFDLAYLAP